MTKKELKKEISCCYNISTTVNKLFQIIIEDKIKLLESCIEHPTKPGYKRKDILEKIKFLKLEL